MKNNSFIEKIYNIYTILVFAAFLRVFKISASSLWLDEGASLYFSGMQIPEMLKIMFIYENHPPLYYILLHYWQMISYSELWLRLLSVIPGILLIYCVYILAKKIYDENTALLSALLTCVSFHYVSFSQEVRMYSFLSAFTFLSASYMLSWSKEDKTRDLILYILFSWLNLYTHIFSIIPFIAGNITFLFLPKNLNKILKWLMAQIIILIFYIPWAYYFIKNHLFFKTYRNYLEIKVHVGFKNILDYLFQCFSGSCFLYSDRFSVILISVLIIFILIRAIINKKELSLTFCGIFFILPIILVFILSSLFSISFFKTRYLIFSAGFFYIIISAMAVRLKNNILKTTIILFFIFLNLLSCYNFYFYPFYQRQNWRFVTSVVIRNFKIGDLILLTPYYSRAVFNYYSGNNYNNVIYSSDSLNTNEQKKYLDRFKKIFYVTVPSLYPEDQVMDYLRSKDQMLVSENTLNFDPYNVLKVSLFLKRSF